MLANHENMMIWWDIFVFIKKWKCVLCYNSVFLREMEMKIHRNEWEGSGQKKESDINKLKLPNIFKEIWWYTYKMQNGLISSLINNIFKTSSHINKLKWPFLFRCMFHNMFVFRRDMWTSSTGCWRLVLISRKRRTVEQVHFISQARC